MRVGGGGREREEWEITCLDRGDRDSEKERSKHNIDEEACEIVPSEDPPLFHVFVDSTAVELCELEDEESDHASDHRGGQVQLPTTPKEGEGRETNGRMGKCSHHVHDTHTHTCATQGRGDGFRARNMGSESEGKRSP